MAKSPVVIIVVVGFQGSICVFTRLNDHAAMPMIKSEIPTRA